jgi:hypothetical protein
VGGEREKLKTEMLKAGEREYVGVGVCGCGRERECVGVWVCGCGREREMLKSWEREEVGDREREFNHGRHGRKAGDRERECVGVWVCGEREKLKAEN